MPIPRTFHGKQILDSGPKTVAQFRLATGWPARVAHRTLQSLVDTGVAERTNRRGTRGYVYRVAA